MFPPLFIVIFILLCLLIVFTYKIKNPVFRWIGIILPPLCLIPLVTIPFDIFTFMFWLPGFFVALISGISVLIGVLRLAKISKDNMDERKQQKIRLIRPALTVFIVCTALLCYRASEKSADNYAVEMGKKIHEICNANQQCPERVEGWEDGEDGDWYSSVIIYGKYGARFRITYSLADDSKLFNMPYSPGDRQSFSMTVKHNIDEGFDVSGGVGKEFKSRLWVAP